MDLQDILSQNPISRVWTLETRKTYQAFYQRMTYSTPLLIKIGKGGLSFYKETANAPIFVCHFNAQPQSNKYDLGFADFRFDALRKYLNVEETIGLIQKMAPPEIVIKVNKLWCSLHFPLNLTEEVASLFVQHIVTRFE